jgi:tetratricopeptide (TPR) repeat protein
MRVSIVLSLAILAVEPPVLSAAARRTDFAPIRQRLRHDLSRGDWDGVHRRIRRGLDQALREADAPATAAWRAELAVWALERHVYFREGREPVMAAITDALRSSEAEPTAEATHTLARLLYRDAFDTRDWAKAKEQVEKAQALWQAAGRRDRLGDVHNYLGLIEFQQGRLDAAEAEFRTALDLARGAGDDNVASSVERHIGFVHERRGAHAAALDMYERSLSGRERLGATVTVPFAQIAVADLLLAWGRERERAAGLFRKAAGLAHLSRSPRAEYTARRRLARLAVAAKDPATARRELDAALAAAQAFGSSQAVDDIRAERAALDRAP